MKTQDLRFCLRKDPVSLDPRKGNDMVASQIQFMMYEGLLQLNEDMTLSPAQAKTYEISPDRKTYTFYLEDAKWSDGSSVTAKDFERSWKNILDPHFPSPDAYLLFPVKNGKQAKKNLCSLDEVGIRALDDKTLVVELEAPIPYFLQIVASSVLLPIHISENPHISNGPFKLKQWKFNQELVFEKNPRYRRANKVKLNHIYIEIIDRELATLHMYASGYFDLIGAPFSFFPAILQNDLEQKNVVTRYPIANTKFLSFNTDAFPFTNANIRRAFSYAINREGITKNITQFNEKEALSIIPPVLLTTRSPLTAQANEKKAREYLEKGLKELQIDSLDSVSFMYVSTEINHLLSQELQNQWSKILGVKVHLEGVEFKTLHERSAGGKYHIGLFALVADYSDPMNVLERFREKSNHRNYPKWDNESYNQLLETALATSSREEYLKIIQKAEALLLDEMPITGLFHENFLFLVHPHVQGFAISPLGQIHFEKLSLAPK